MNKPITKWWLYIYNTMVDYLINEKTTQAELIETLQKFITQSNLAEFENRLKLLFVFHCHASHFTKTKSKETFVSILYNVHAYFSQFKESVTQKIKELRAPIEKKLKDYVKIVRWKDISYWAIKETLQKTHRTLHKHMREFQQVLDQPVQPFLTNYHPKDAQNLGIWDRPQRHLPKVYHYTMDSQSYVVKNTPKASFSSPSKPLPGVLNNANKYLEKAKTFSKQTIDKTRYPILIKNLEGFLKDVISTSEHLEGLEVDTTLEKRKQKSQAKSIVQQKHRCLADLFKNLTKIGVSHRSGLVTSKLQSNFAEYTIKPIDLDVCLSHLNYRKNNERILTIWDGCEMYYNRCLMRLDVLQTALNNPHKDLGLQNVERCKGFAFELMAAAKQQKEKLVDTTRCWYYIRHYISCFEDLCHVGHFADVQLIQNTEQFLEKVAITMSQCKILLETCPQPANFGDEIIQIPIITGERFDLHKGDENWNQITTYITEIQNVTHKLQLVVEKIDKRIPSVEQELFTPSYVFIQEVGVILNSFDALVGRIRDMQRFFGDVLADSLIWLEESAVELQKRYQGIGEGSQDEFRISSEMEKLTEKVLVVIQSIYKRYSEKAEEVIEEKSEPEDDDVYVINEDHFKGLILQSLNDDLDCLQFNEVFKVLHKTAAKVLKMNPTADAEARNAVGVVIPLLEQLSLLYQYYITQQVSSYRITCKMTSILLNIFINLVSKGFCIPPELSDEMDAEGQSQSSGGMGLGDGEGEKDVSDRIESEDQLEDAQPAGQEKEKEDDKDCKEEDKGIEMSEDFDSKLQDVQDKQEDEENDSNSDSDHEEQMGDTGDGDNKLDKQIWDADEDENEDDNGKNDKEEHGDKGETEGEPELAANEGQSKPEDDQTKEKENKNEKNKEINEMLEPELDDEQTDPYHGNQPELPEPEPMDLPDDLECDDEEQGQNEQEEENPFDIDKQKEEMSLPDEPDESKGEEKMEEESARDASSESDDDDDEKEGEGGTEQPAEAMEADTENDKQDDSQKVDEEQEENNAEEKSGLDETPTAETAAQAMDVERTASGDNVETSQSEQSTQNQASTEIEENKAKDDGVGQAQTEENVEGHSGNDAEQFAQQKTENSVENLERKRKPGESHSERTLGDTKQPAKKRLKTIEPSDTDDNTQPENEETRKSETYQHIKEAKGKTEQILDTATKEQAEVQHDEEAMVEDDLEAESAENLPPAEEEKDAEMSEVATQNSEKVDSKDEKDGGKNKQHPEGEILEDLEHYNVEGDVVRTEGVSRGAESFHHTQFDGDVGAVAGMSSEEIHAVRATVEQQLSSWHQLPSDREAEQAWQKITSLTTSLAQDLSEQLRLVLEPTQATRLKGDFRTGRRINMRKVIPYIASQFRKDKIWLRRTKPSKRDYQIVLAIDDSSSMADNKSKELTFESVALISKALALLECGQLSVLSFGERVEVVHKLSEPFSERSGMALMQKFTFAQKKTCIADVVKFATEMLNGVPGNVGVLNAKLLIVLSDGRLSSDVERNLQQAIRFAKLCNIFMVFVIVDDPNNENSILDMRKVVFKEGKCILESYMDRFPFPFYIVLKDIGSLPSVLSDALRQWFEIVSNMD